MTSNLGIDKPFNIYISFIRVTSKIVFKLVISILLFQRAIQMSFVSKVIEQCKTFKKLV
jgi:hypothetical protein